jgi:hypothetical protein
MAPPKKKTKQADMQEVGRSGLTVYSGRIHEESIAKLRGDGWRRVVRDMLNDAVLNGFLTGVEMLARQVTWEIKPFSDQPEDQKDADFIREALFQDMTVTWQDTLSEILSFLPWGWAWFEICYKRRGGETKDKTTNSRFSDGKVGWRKFAIRSQESLTEWKFDDFNEVIAMIQTPAPDFKTRTIPIEKSLHFRTSSHKDNPEGKSLLRGAYREWYFKVNIQNIEGIGIERDLAGLPIFELPAEYFNTNATDDQQQILEACRKMVKEVRRDEAEGIVMPVAFDDNKNKLTDFKLLSTGGRRQFDTSAIINRYDHRMLLSVLADFMMLGSAAVGSYALSTDKTELFTSAMSAWMDSICETFNRDAIPRLMKLNGRPTDRVPKLFHGEVEQVSLKDLGDFLQKTNGIDLELDDEEKAWVKQQAGIPVTPKSVKDKEDSEKSDKSAEKSKDEEAATDEESDGSRSDKGKTDDAE